MKLAVLKKLGEQLAALDAEMQPLPTDKRATVQPAFDELAREHRLGLLELGAPGRLAGSGNVEVLPLDDDRLLDAARPVSRQGKVGFDPQAVEARHDGQVQAVLSSGPCSLIVIGGKHDLSASLRRLKGQRVEYVRVRTRGYNEVAAAQD